MERVGTGIFHEKTLALDISETDIFGGTFFAILEMMVDMSKTN